MGPGLRRFRRVALLLAIWLLVGILWYKTIDEFTYYRSLRSEVSGLKHEKGVQTSELTKMLVEENELLTNPDHQVEILQRDFGFTRLDETPILIVPEDGSPNN